MSNPATPSRHFAYQPTSVRPRPDVAHAVTLMLVGAALEIAGAVLAIATEGSLTPWFAAGQPRSSASQVHALVVAQGETQLAIFLPAAACWLVMAYANSHARGNAPRIISAIFFLMGLSSLRGDGAPRTTAVLIISIIICLVGAATVALLFSDLIPRPLRKRAGVADACGPVRSVRTNRLAIATLVCGFLSLILFPAGIAAVIMAPRAQRQISRTGQNGDSLAVLGRTLGYAGLALAVISLLIPLALLLLFTPTFTPGLPTG